MLPSYWWIDDHDVVRIVASVYHTLALRAGGAPRPDEAPAAPAARP